MSQQQEKFNQNNRSNRRTYTHQCGIIDTFTVHVDPKDKNQIYMVYHSTENPMMGSPEKTLWEIKEYLLEKEKAMRS